MPFFARPKHERTIQAVFREYVARTRWTLGGVAIFCALIYIVSGLYIAVVVAKSYSWPSVVGTIISSQVVAKTGVKNVTYLPEVQYRYSVGGIPYQSGRIGLFGPGAFQFEAGVVVSRFPTGSSARVFYEPLAPVHAALVRGLSRGQLSVAGAALILIVAGLLVFPGWEVLRRPKAA